MASNVLFPTACVSPASRLAYPRPAGHAARERARANGRGFIAAPRRISGINSFGRICQTVKMAPGCRRRLLRRRPPAFPRPAVWRIRACVSPAALRICARRSRGAGKSACKRPGLHCSAAENIRNQFVRQNMPNRQNAAGLPAQASPPAAARVSPASRLAYPRPASVAAMPPIAVSRSSIGSWRPTRYIASTT